MGRLPYSTDGRLANRELFHDLRPRNFVSEAFDDESLLVGSDLEIPVAMPSLLNHIVHVVLMRSEEQMRRIHASSKVALVTNKQAVRDWPVIDRPRDSTGDKPLTVVLDASISLRTEKTNPRPAFIGSVFVCFSPELFGKSSVLRSASLIVLASAALNGLAAKVGRRCKMSLAACAKALPEMMVICSNVALGENCEAREDLSGKVQRSLHSLNYIMDGWHHALGCM